jgi:hypothetical protein
MSVIVPDSLEGALILSVIDFFLSFLFISFIGLVLACFPFLNRLQERLASKRQRVVVPVPSGPEKKDDGIPQEHVAAIAAAVYSVLGPHRIVHIEERLHGGWAAAGRQSHHESHKLPHHPKEP